MLILVTFLPHTKEQAMATPLRPRPHPAGNPPVDAVALERCLAQLERIL
jgi:hypothetical protein